MIRAYLRAPEIPKMRPVMANLPTAAMPSTSPPNRAGTGVNCTNVVAFPTNVWSIEQKSERRVKAKGRCAGCQLSQHTAAVDTGCCSAAVA
jgi:hypothetical protein